MRVFFKYFNQYNTQKEYKFTKAHKKIKAEITNRKTNNFNIKDILKIIEEDGIEDPIVKKNSRKIISQVLRETKKS